MTKTFRPVALETPYAGDVTRNVAYARACMKDCLLKGDAPFASHCLYTQSGVLNDGNKKERAVGMEAGLALSSLLQASVVYTDLGISNGMKQGIDRAIKENRPVEYRSLGNEIVSKLTPTIEVDKSKFKKLLKLAGRTIKFKLLIDTLGLGHGGDLNTNSPLDNDFYTDTKDAILLYKDMKKIIGADE